MHIRKCLCSNHWVILFIANMISFAWASTTRLEDLGTHHDTKQTQKALSLLWIDICDITGYHLVVNEHIEKLR